LADIQHLD